MVWITETELRNRLPRNGDGVTPEEITGAIDAAVEYVEAMGGEDAVKSPLCRKAVADYAQASCLDIIFPRDARDRDSGAITLRQNADAAISRYREIREAREGGTEPDGVPDAYVGHLNW
jgi:hypothetical protein